MKKYIASTLTALLLFGSASAATHTVVKGDSMWKIAVKYEVGLSEIKSANPHIKNPELIYPGDVLEIPEKDSATTDFIKEVVHLVNVERSKAGLSALSENWELSRVAQYKAEDMKKNNYFSHESPVYGTPFEMMKNFGISYRYAAENIAMGQRTPESVVKAWMNSSGHRKNILNKNYTKIGIGYVKSGNYWVQMFTG